jgi:hypothetical protein
VLTLPSSAWDVMTRHELTIAYLSELTGVSKKTISQYVGQLLELVADDDDPTDELFGQE